MAPKDTQHGEGVSTKATQPSSATIRADCREAFTAITAALSCNAKPEANKYILHVIAELLKYYTSADLVAAAMQALRDNWVQKNRQLPSAKLNYLFFTDTKITDGDKKLANSVKRYSDWIVKAQESEAHSQQATAEGSQPVKRIVFGGNNE